MKNMEKKIEALVRLCTAESASEEYAMKELLRSLKCDGEEAPDLNIRICRVLRLLGVPEHLSGHLYLQEAVELVMREPSYLRHVTTALYPDVARKYQSSPGRVERCIRHAIETAWSRCDLDTLSEYFGNTISPVRGKPVNSEFIARVASAVRQEA